MSHAKLCSETIACCSPEAHAWAGLARPCMIGISLYGVADLAGMQAGFYGDLEAIVRRWHGQPRVISTMCVVRHEWLDALQRVRSED